MTEALKSMTLTEINDAGAEIVAQYIKLTGREARIAIYERSIYDFLSAGFTVDEFVLVVTFIVRENKKNKFQYSIKLGALLDDHKRSMDLLGEAKAKARNRIKSMTPKESIIEAWRPIVGDRVTGNVGHHISEFIKQPNHQPKKN